MGWDVPSGRCPLFHVEGQQGKVKVIGAWEVVSLSLLDHAWPRHPSVTRLVYHVTVALSSISDHAHSTWLQSELHQCSRRGKSPLDTLRDNIYPSFKHQAKNSGLCTQRVKIIDFILQTTHIILKITVYIIMSSLSGKY